MTKKEDNQPTVTVPSIPSIPKIEVVKEQLQIKSQQVDVSPTPDEMLQKDKAPPPKAVQSVSLADINRHWQDFAKRYEGDIQMQSLLNHEIQLQNETTIVLPLNLVLQKDLFDSIKTELLDYLKTSTGHQGLTIALESMKQKSKKEILFEQYPEIIDFVKKLDLDI